LRRKKGGVDDLQKLRSASGAILTFFFYLSNETQIAGSG
jgi:hypothetical protein